MQKAAEDAVSTFSQQFCMQEAAEDALSMFSQQLNTQYTANMTAKLGLQKYDKDIAVDLLTNMYEDKTGVQQSLKAASAQLSPAAKCRTAVHALCCLVSTLGPHRAPWFSTCMLCLWSMRPMLQSACAAQQQLLRDVVYQALACKVATLPCDVLSGCFGRLTLICHLADFTNTFRSLASVHPEDSSDDLPGPLQEVGLPILAFPMSLFAF